MPQLSPAFLHQPMSGISLERVEAACAWLWDGVRAFLPTDTRLVGWRLESALYAYAGSDELSPAGLRERSWLGGHRLAAGAGDRASLPATVVLSPSLTFETSVELPNAARATLRQTIALRMDEISPIPTEEAAFAVGETKAAANGRFEVAVAIVRRQTLHQVKSAFAGSDVLVIGASPDTDGSLRYIFEQYGQSRRKTFRKLVLCGLALWASLLLLAGAIETRQSRALAALEAYQGDLRDEARALREAGERLARRQQYAPAYIEIPEVYRSLRAFAETLPEDAVITQLIASGNRISVTGLAPSGETGGADVRVTLSDYPGFDRFEHATPFDAAPDGAAP